VRVNSADSIAELGKRGGSSRMPKSRSSDTRRKSSRDQSTSSKTMDQRKSKKDVGPGLGMKKSSSLESLQTMVQEIQSEEDAKAGFGPGRSAPPAVRVIRGRGCNESFRQAVDRSYEAPLAEYQDHMETCKCELSYGRGKLGSFGILLAMAVSTR